MLFDCEVMRGGYNVGCELNAAWMRGSARWMRFGCEVDTMWMRDGFEADAVRMRENLSHRREKNKSSLLLSFSPHARLPYFLSPPFYPLLPFLSPLLSPSPLPQNHEVMASRRCKIYIYFSHGIKHVFYCSASACGTLWLCRIIVFSYMCFSFVLFLY